MAKTIFNVTVTTITPFFTGEVREEDRRIAKNNKIAFPIRKTSTGKVIIPFKGALRATLEVMLRKEGKKACDTGEVGVKPCGHCTTCYLFGGMGKRGKVFTDFLISELNKNQIVKVATHIRLNRNDGTISDTFKGEEVIEGAVFKSKIIIENSNNEEIELIKKALKEIEKKGLGGWTNKGYGRVFIEYTVE